MKQRYLLPIIAVACLFSATAQAEDHSFVSPESCETECAPEQSLCKAKPVSIRDAIRQFEAAGARDRRVHKELLDGTLYITIFHTHDCPHCKEALSFLSALKERGGDCDLCRDAFADIPGEGHRAHLVIRAYEVKKNPINMRLFRVFAHAYGTELRGVPTIFMGDKFYVGYRKGSTCKLIVEEMGKLLEGEDGRDGSKVDIPFIGEVDIHTVSLFRFTVLLGFLDGFNPCAMWVLMFLLGLLIHSQSRKKILIIGTTFVTASGFVYFCFMAAWFNLFLVIGFSSYITVMLALVAVVMGLINLKDVFFFKRGVSLMIPESAKPSLYKRARAILHEQHTIFAIIGTVFLALFVNLIELACTVGLPAIFTKILVARDVPTLEKYLYLILYNVTYVIPLLIIVVLFAITLGRFKMSETHARILKLISGLIMVALGLILLLRPELLILS